MATAFSYSGTGLESAIQSGSGGIGTGSSITLEVNAVPSDLSQGDTVKVALGSASDWSGGNGETAYGDIGGAGANGGTNITLTDRGQEGTSAASWSEGDPVRVGVQGRSDVQTANLKGGWLPPEISGNARVQLPYWGSGRNSESPDRPRFTAFPVSHPMRVTAATIEITSAGSSPGDVDIRIYDSTTDIKPNNEIITVTDSTDGGATSTGEKTFTTDVVLTPCLYFVGVHLNNWGATPSFRAIKSGGPSWKSSNNHFADKGVGWNSSFTDTLDSFTVNSRLGDNTLGPIVYLTTEYP